MYNYLALLPLCLVVFVLYDAYVTVLSHRGAGPLTKWWTELFWRLVLWSRYRLNLEFPIQRAGPLVLGLIIAVWYLLLYLSWFTMFWLGAESLTNPKDPVIDPLDVMYYIGTTFSTLGTGDYLPNGFPWTLLTSFGALIMTLLTTAAVSYILPIVTAVVGRRVLIVSLNSIGSSTEDILRSAWGQSDSCSLDDQVMGAASELLSESFKTQVYPVLSYFYFQGSHGSLNGAVLNLFDAIAFMKLNPGREGNMSSPKLDYVYNCLKNYVHSMRNSTSFGAKQPSVSHADFEELCQIKPNNVMDATPSSDHHQTLADMLELRELLLLFTYWEGRCSNSEVDGICKASIE